MEQVQRNHDAYIKIKHSLEQEYSGGCAVMNDGDIIEIYDDSGDAYAAGCKQYGLGKFTVEEIGAAPISLGILGLNVA